MDQLNPSDSKKNVKQSQHGNYYLCRELEVLIHDVVVRLDAIAQKLKDDDRNTLSLAVERCSKVIRTISLV